MGTVEFTADVMVKCSPERAFDYFADHRHVAAAVEGVSRWEPIGARTEGVGARYDVEMKAFGFPLNNVLRLNRWLRPKEIGWVSESGLIKQSGGFTFTEVGHAVRIELRIAYEPPASFIGAAIARRMDGTVRRRLERALERIRDVLESDSEQA
ncbi:MAG: SRPBCC family protein [Candidatus Dormiibacterota bacterium]